MNERTGAAAWLTIYVASTHGAGKTRRLLEEAIRLQDDGMRVVIGFIDTKARRDLDLLASRLPRNAVRMTSRDGGTVEEFDFDAALRLRPEVVVLDDLAHVDLSAGAQRMRWEDALALRKHGVNVLGALDVAHIETVAPAAAEVFGAPLHGLVPISVLRQADHAIALDVSLDQLEARGISDGHSPQTLRALRELMLRTIDDLETPDVTPERTSTALALATGDGETAAFLRRSANLARALDLALDVALVGERDIDGIVNLSQEVDARVVPLERFDAIRPDLSDLKATLVSVPCGDLAYRIASRAVERDTFIVDPTPHTMRSDDDIAFPRYAQTVGDRLRIGYGRLTIYFGAAPGSGKTFAMLDRAHQLLADGVDVVGALVDTHERAETAEKLQGLPMLLPRRVGNDGAAQPELDLPALLDRRPAVAVIDALEHTNAPGGVHARRYDDVLQALRAGISVMTTLDVQHLEGLSDAVVRLTGQRIIETVPDDVLRLADDVILVDVTAENLRNRLRDGKICAPQQAQEALAHGFRTERLSALRELALREVMRARGERGASPFSRLILGVKARARDVALIERCARIALRLEIDLTVVHVVRRGETPPNDVIETLAATARRAGARWHMASGNDVAAELLGAVARESASTLALEGARTRPVWPRTATFARRLLDAGAKQLLILAPAP